MSFTYETLSCRKRTRCNPLMSIFTIRDLALVGILDYSEHHEIKRSLQTTRELRMIIDKLRCTSRGKHMSVVNLDHD